MLDMIGTRQKELLELLLHSKSGLTVDALSEGLTITRNAVRQHLAALELNGLVEKGLTRPSGGRPEQLYVLTPKGHGLFPKQYSWFAQLLLEMVAQTLGEAELTERLQGMGKRTAEQLKGTYPDAGSSSTGKVEKLAAILADLGYQARTSPAFKGIPIVEADNCVFHDLAKQHPAVCQFDLALMSTFTEMDVIHGECMATGGYVCRFQFKEKG